MRPKLTAGFAKEVEEVKMWPATIQSATAAGIRFGFWSTSKRINSTNPKVAITSPRKTPVPSRSTELMTKAGLSNIRFARAAPLSVPNT